jgi:dihydrofolate reductase
MTWDRVIGRGNKIPWRIKSDLKHFKELTTDHSIIMGRNTWESLGSRPLKNRHNIVLTRSYIVDNISECCAVSSIEEALDKVCGDDVWVIGGAEVYRQFLPIADELHISWIKNQVGGDVYFPEFRNSVGSTWFYNRSDNKDMGEFIYTVYDRKQRGFFDT